MAWLHHVSSTALSYCRHQLRRLQIRANEIHIKSDVEYFALAPLVVMDLAKDFIHLENISGLRGLVFAGGPLSQATGKLVAERTNMTGGNGHSEDWNLLQPVFVNFPYIDECRSKDLFTRHPTKPGLWKYASCLDDIIVFSNGEKLNPITFESLVTISPHVKGYFVIGQGRFQATLLVEPVEANEDRLLEKIWPILETANEPAVKHGRSTKDHVLFTITDKPLPTSWKRNCAVRCCQQAVCP